MKRASVAVVVLCCLLVAVWFSGGDGLSYFGGNGRELSKPTALEGVQEADKPVKFRSRERVDEPTHRPEQLVRFYLPEVEIDGLGLEAALEKLNDAYVRACEASGEIPLAFRFVVPPDDRSVIRLKLSAKTFSASVRMLAAACGMNVKRNGLTYHFGRLPDEGEAKERTVEAPPNMIPRLAEMAGVEDGEAKKMGLRALLERMGIGLHPDTRIAMSGGKITITAAGPADAAKLDVFLGTLASLKIPAITTTPRFLVLPKDSGIDPATIGTMRDPEYQVFIREMAMMKGTVLMSMPSTVSRPGQSTKNEIVRGVSLLTENSPDESHTMKFRKTVEAEASPLGFGQSIKARYTDTDMVFNESSERMEIRARADTSYDGFVPDNGVGVSFRKMADGTTLLMMVNGQLVDHTGRPLHEGGH